jgi:hypothetical protein
MSRSEENELEQMGRVFEQAPYPVFICDTRAELVFANSAAHQLYSSLHKAPHIRQWTSIAELRYPQTGVVLDRYDYPMARALRGEIVSNAVFEVLHLSTQVKQKISIDAHPVYSASGELLGAVSVHHPLP